MACKSCMINRLICFASRFTQRNQYTVFIPGSYSISPLAVNIHSHWGGAVLFVYLLCGHLPGVLATYDTDATADLLFLLAFGLAAITCLFFSGTYHMAGCHSLEVPSVRVTSAVKQKKLTPLQVANFCHKLDYWGISILIVGSMYPCIYYSFYCHTNFRDFYLTAITIAGLGSSPFSSSPPPPLTETSNSQGQHT